MATFQNSINQGTTKAATNIILGTLSANTLTTGTGLVALGYNVMPSATQQTSTIGIGNNTYGSISASGATGSAYSIAIGYQAGYFGGGSTGHNIAMGYLSQNAGGGVSNNIALGQSTQYTGSGASFNIAIGANSQGASGVSHSRSVAVGSYAQGFISASDCTAVGDQAQRYLTGGAHNTAVGALSGGGTGPTATGADNTTIGYNTFPAASSGAFNTICGSTGGVLLTSGGYNLFLGYNAGSVPTTQSSNIYLMNVGAAEANTIRIGTEGTGSGQQNACFIAGDVTTTSATSGATRTLLVSNSSNTASSQAKVQCTVAGTSAGDAYDQYTVTGTTDWTLGLDNSDSDAFVVAQGTALGTNNCIRIATTGEIPIFPINPPAFVRVKYCSDL